MSLVTCPECGREKVSDTAVSCPNCGYAIKEHFERIRLEEERIAKEKVFEAQRQEKERHKKETEGERQTETIDRLEKQIKKSSIEMRNGGIGLVVSVPLLILFWSINNHGSMGVLIAISIFAVFISLVFLIAGYNERKTVITDLELARQSIDKYEKNLGARLERIAQQNQAQAKIHAAQHPKCPVCGSTNTRRISTANRSASVLMVGLASSKIGKQYECRNCKHKW